MIPGTDCINPCIHVYEGQVDFEQKTLTINCQQLEIENQTISFKLVENGYPVYKENTTWPAIYIQVPGKDVICIRAIRFKYLGDDSKWKMKYLATFSNGPNNLLRLVPEPKFWEAYHQNPQPIVCRILTQEALLFADTDS